MERFVKKFETKKVVVGWDVGRIIECFGTRCFDNGHIAFVTEKDVKVYNSSSVLVDEGLNDVFYFKTGESFRKYNQNEFWGFYDNYGRLVAKAKDVKVLNSKILALKEKSGRWCVYALFDYSRPLQLLCSTKYNVTDVIGCNLDKTQVLFLFVMPNEIELETVNMLFYKPVYSLLVRSFQKLFGQLYAVSSNDVLVCTNKGNNFVEVAEKDGNVFEILDQELKLKYAEVSAVISLSNGMYFLKTKEEWKLFSKIGKEVGHFFDVKIKEEGKIFASFKEGDEVKLIGLYNEKYVWFSVDNRTIVTDGIVVHPFVKVNFGDVIFV